MHHTRRVPNDLSALVVAPPAPAFTALDLLATVGRYWFLILLLAGAMGYGGFKFAGTLPSRYMAEALMISDTRRTGIVELEEGGYTGLEDTAATGTIVETVNSQIVIRRALATLSPEQMQRLRELSGITKREAEGLPPVADETAFIVRFVSQSLKVENSGRSYVVGTKFTSTDVAMAAAIPNAIVTSYVDYRTELRRQSYELMMKNAGAELDTLRTNLRAAETAAQTAREQVQLLSQSSRTQSGTARNAAIQRSADLFATQREAEREAAAMAVIYERLLLNQSNLQSRMETPELNVQIFSAAVEPLRPTGVNPKPVLLALGVMVGGMIALSLGMMRDGFRRRKEAKA